MCCSVLQCVAVCCSVLQFVAVCCSVVQCVAVCCRVLACVAELQCVNYLSIFSTLHYSRHVAAMNLCTAQHVLQGGAMCCSAAVSNL